MMFLLKKKDKEILIGQNEIQYMVKDGWNVIKPLPDCPYSVKSMRCDSRTVKDIIQWYQQKIDENKLRMKKYSDELKRFQRIIKKD